MSADTGKSNSNTHSTVIIFFAIIIFYAACCMHDLTVFTQRIQAIALNYKYIYYLLTGIVVDFFDLVSFFSLQKPKLNANWTAKTTIDALLGPT